MYSPFILLILGNMDKDPQDMSMNANRNVYMIIKVSIVVVVN